MFNQRTMEALLTFGPLVQKALTFREGVVRDRIWLDTLYPGAKPENPKMRMPALGTKRRARIQRQVSGDMNITDRILKLLASMPGEAFQAAAIKKALKDVKEQSVSATLSTLAATGRIERVSKGVYKKKASATAT